MSTESLDEARARSLLSEVQELARAHQYRALLDLALDHETLPTLHMLPEKATANARVHLEAALTWQKNQYERTSRRLDETRAALDAYDLRLARGLLRRIDPLLLTEPDQERFQEMLLEVEARTLETEKLAELAERLEPPAPAPRRRWWRRGTA